MNSGKTQTQLCVAVIFLISSRFWLLIWVLFKAINLFRFIKLKNQLNTIIEKNITKTQINLLKIGNDLSLKYVFQSQTKNNTGNVHKANANIINAQDINHPELEAKTWILCVNQHGRKKLSHHIKNAYFGSFNLYIFFVNFEGNFIQSFNHFGNKLDILSHIYNITIHAIRSNILLNINISPKNHQNKPKIHPNIKKKNNLQIWNFAWIKAFELKLLSSST